MLSVGLRRSPDGPRPPTRCRSARRPRPVFGERIVFTQPVTVAGAARARRAAADRRRTRSGPSHRGRARRRRPGRTTLTYHARRPAATTCCRTRRSAATWRVTGRRARRRSLGPRPACVYADDAVRLEDRDGDLVRVHWYEGGDAFGAQALQIGEDGDREAATLLGVTETEPVDFYIYADQASFYDALGPATRENVGGQAARGHPDAVRADPADRRSTTRGSGIVIPHELDAPRVRHRRPQPVPLPAALAQRGPRRLPRARATRRLTGPPSRTRPARAR